MGFDSDHWHWGFPHVCGDEVAALFFASFRFVSTKFVASCH